MSGAILREDMGGWPKLTLNRPDKLNSLNVEMFALLRSHVEDLAQSSGIGCAVIQGAGK